MYKNKTDKVKIKDTYMCIYLYQMKYNKDMWRIIS